MDFQDVAPGGKTFGGETESIDAEGKILKDEVAVGGNLEAALETVAFTEKFTASSEACAFWIAYFDMKLTAETLGARGDSGGEEEQACQQTDADMGPFSVHCQEKYATPSVSIWLARARVFPR